MILEVDLNICNLHKGWLQLKHVKTPDMDQMVLVSCQNSGKIPPNFSKTTLEWISNAKPIGK